MRWTFFGLLLARIIASGVGYVDRFSAVQSSRLSKAALIWLCLEAGLSITRIILWGINFKGDGTPPLGFTFKPDKCAPLPTCCELAEEIEEFKILPLVHAAEFLEEIISYTGILHRFSDPRLTLYYTLTHRLHVATDPNLNSKYFLSEGVLYIIVFDHTEKTREIPESPGQEYHGIMFLLGRSSDR